MNYVSLANFRVGSSAFFEDINGFVPKDEDELHIMRDGLFGKNSSYCLRNDGKDIIIYPNFSKEEFIEKDLADGDSIKVGKYLVKEFAQYIGLNIQDLKRLKPLIDGLDGKHMYEKHIFESYIENNDFVLTKEQLDEAYDEYKKARLK